VFGAYQAGRRDWRLKFARAVFFAALIPAVLAAFLSTWVGLNYLANPSECASFNDFPLFFLLPVVMLSAAFVALSVDHRGALIGTIIGALILVAFFAGYVASEKRATWNSGAMTFTCVQL
jgi:hypothetical protein